MKKLLLLVLIYTPLLVKNSTDKLVSTYDDYRAARITELYRAICRVESNNDSTAINRAENAIGIAQIRKIMVKHINALRGTNYRHRDAFSTKKSFEMFMIIQEYYNPEYDFEKGARIWNGGPNGFRKSSTLLYWSKVNKQLTARK